MSAMWTRLRNKLRYLVERHRIDAELAEELAIHREMLADDAEGPRVNRANALRSAARRLGNTVMAVEDARNEWTIAWLDRLVRDVRYAFRSFAHNPRFTVVALVTLALGIGANTTMFTIVNAVLLRPLPYRDPDRLVRIFFNNAGVGLRDVPFSVPEFDDLRNRAGVFDDVSASMPASVNLTGASQPERLELLGTSANYFSMLGAVPEIGRVFDGRDLADGFAQVAVISDAMWRRAYGADPAVLGRSLRLDNDLYTVVGVLPAGFRHPGRTIARDVEVWAATGFRADPFPRPLRGARLLPVAIGRLKPGITMGAAQARLNSLAAELRREFAKDYPPRADWSIEIQPLQQSLVGDVQPLLLLLLGAVVLVVLVVALNIGGLLLARASGRQQEMAMRAALGASSVDLVRQLLTESLLLALIGGSAGVVGVVATLGGVLHFLPAEIPRLTEVGVTWSVVAFALVLSLASGVLFGLAPAVHATRGGMALAAPHRARATATATRLRDALIVAELAVAVVLMIGAGLLIRTLFDLLHSNPGFNPSQIVTANIWLPVPNDPHVDPYLTLDQQNAFTRELLRRMTAIPGVDGVAITSDLPTGGQTVSTALVTEDSSIESLQDLRGELIRVSPEYFRVMQTALVRGRFFTERDEAGRQLVAIIDEATARRYWPARDPIGRRLRLGATRPWVTVVGIVRDIKHDGLDVDNVPHVYVPIYQNLIRTPNLAVRTALAPRVLESRIGRAVHGIDPGLPVFNVASMADVLGASLAPRRVPAMLVAGFAALAVLLAAIGIYGLLTYMVGQRMREIGVRTALGAPRRDILVLVVHKGAVLAAVGVAAGLVVAAPVASAIASLLYGVRPHDPAVFVAAPAAIFAIALMASYVPARRAARVDPQVALRES